MPSIPETCLFKFNKLMDHDYFILHKLCIDCMLVSWHMESKQTECSLGIALKAGILLFYKSFLCIFFFCTSYGTFCY